MNIGFDLDKVLVNYPPLIPAAIFDRLYKEKANGELKYRIPSRPEQMFRSLTHYTIFRRPIAQNLAFARMLAKKNHNKYYLISSRFGFLKKKTEQLVKKYQLGEIFHAMYFNFHNQQPHIFKDEIIKKLKIAKYVDDDLHLLKYVARENPFVACFWLNRNKTGQLTNNLFAITKLTEMKI